MSGSRRTSRRRAAATLLAATLPLAGTGTGGAVELAEVAVRAVDPLEFKRRFYVGGGVGGSRLEPRSPVADLRVGDDRDTGFHLSLGYDVARWLSVELQLADLGAAGLDRDTAATATTPAIVEEDFDRIDYQVYDVAAIVYLFNARSGPMTSRVAEGLSRRESLSLYARAGLGVMRNDAERDRVDHERNFAAHASVGLGLEYGFSSGIALRGEFVSFDTDARYASLGVLKRFGRVPRAEPRAPIAPVTVEEETDPPPPSPALPTPTLTALFATDSAELTAAYRDALDRFADLVRPGLAPLLVHGHTDSAGPEAYNERLALRRANAVRDHLRSRGIAAGRLRIGSFGESRPTATNRSADGRALNRRVEIRSL